MIKKALPSYRFLLDRKYIVILINSTAVFLIAYLFTFLVTSFSTVVAASSFNIKTIVNLERVEFLIRSKDWTMDAIRVVYSTGPFISFLLALLFLVIYSRIVIYEWFGRLFLLWFFVLLFCRFFGELFIGSLLMKGIGYTIVYMYYKDTSKMLVIMTSAFIQIMAGFLMTRYFIFSGNIYFNEINSGNRRAFILSQAFIPFILGNILLIVIKSPKITGFEILINASLFLFILPVLIRSRYLDNIYFTEGEKRVRIQWITIALSIILLILYRIVFAMGFRPDFHLS